MMVVRSVMMKMKRSSLDMCFFVAVRSKCCFQVFFVISDLLAWSDLR